MELVGDLIRAMQNQESQNLEQCVAASLRCEQGGQALASGATWSSTTFRPMHSPFLYPQAKFRIYTQRRSGQRAHTHNTTRLIGRRRTAALAALAPAPRTPPAARTRRPRPNDRCLPRPPRPPAAAARAPPAFSASTTSAAQPCKRTPARPCSPCRPATRTRRLRQSWESRPKNGQSEVLGEKTRLSASALRLREARACASAHEVGSPHAVSDADALSAVYAAALAFHSRWKPQIRARYYGRASCSEATGSSGRHILEIEFLSADVSALYSASGPCAPCRSCQCPAPCPSCSR
eukprot:6192243-Pleurochrysis_carterae.AAC.1